MRKERRWNIRFVVLAAAAMLSAQQTGRISGVVIDQAGAVIPQAQVTVIHGISKQKFQMTADATGRFTFADVVPVTYALEAIQNGFKKTIRNRIEVGSNASITVPSIVLKVINPFPNGCGEFLGFPTIELEEIATKGTEIIGTVVSYPSMAYFQRGAVTATNAGDCKVTSPAMTDGHGKFQLKHLKPVCIVLRYIQRAMRTLSLIKLQLNLAAALKSLRLLCLGNVRNVGRAWLSRKFMTL